jgi:hypothetical protein
MTIRSADNDLYAQPMGQWIGRPTVATNVTFAGPELRGAHNVVLPGIDHRETHIARKPSLPPTSSSPARPRSARRSNPKAASCSTARSPAKAWTTTRRQGAFSTNLPLAGATVEVYAVDAATGQRIGSPRWRKTVGTDGRWGPFSATSGTPFES